MGVPSGDTIAAAVASAQGLPAPSPSTGPTPVTPESSAALPLPNPLGPPPFGPPQAPSTSPAQVPTAPLPLGPPANLLPGQFFPGIGDNIGGTGVGGFVGPRRSGGIPTPGGAVGVPDGAISGQNRGSFSGSPVGNPFAQFDPFSRVWTPFGGFNTDFDSLLQNLLLLMAR